jgi:hypothetical protein
MLISGKILAHNTETKRSSIQHVPRGCTIIDNTPPQWTVGDIIEWNTRELSEQLYVNVTRQTRAIVYVRIHDVSSGTSHMHTNCTNPSQLKTNNYNEN